MKRMAGYFAMLLASICAIGAAPEMWVYVPAGYVPGTVLPLMVDHDGRAEAVIHTTLIGVMDNLMAMAAA